MISPAEEVLKSEGKQPAKLWSDPRVFSEGDDRERKLPRACCRLWSELQAYIDTNVVTVPVLLDDEVNPADDLVSSQTTIHGPADSHKHEPSSLLPFGSADLHRGASSQFAASVHHRPTHRPPSPIYAIREASTHSRLPVHRHPSDPPQPTYPNLRSMYPPAPMEPRR
ncbi:hypothetical protein DIPPA_17042 [Diplonema papillatum]|nr:hypothetical protein DIPPA_17042 [Diplonema papillatum]